MRWWKRAALLAGAIAVWRGRKKRRAAPAAFANGQEERVRDAGPEAMRDPPSGWSKADERDDESFPASDPPGNY